MIGEVIPYLPKIQRRLPEISPGASTHCCDRAGVHSDRATLVLRIGRVSVTIRLLVYFSCTEAAEVSAGQGPVGQIKVSSLCL
jgi:hypothetical protein